MKTTKRILSMLLCLAMVIGFIPTFTAPVRAADEITTPEFVAQNKWGTTTTKIDGTVIELDSVASFVCAKNSGGTVPTYYTGAIRAYGKNSVTISVAEGYEIVEVIITTTSDKYAIASSNCSLTNADMDITGTTVTLTPSNAGITSIILTNPNSSGNFRIAKMKVTYKAVGGAVECAHTTTELRNDVAATCTTDGYTGDTHCVDCNAKLETGSVIPATGHTDENADKLCDTCGFDLNIRYLRRLLLI